MTQNGNGFSGFAKGLLVGSALGVALALLYAPRSRKEFSSDIPGEGISSQRGYQSLPTAKAERILAAGKRVKPSIGWRVIFYVASAVAMISDWRMKRT